MKKYTSALLVPCLPLQLFGCYSMQSISGESLPYKNSYPRLLVLTTDGRQIEFQENQYIIISDTLQGEGIELGNKQDNESKPFNGSILVSIIKRSSIEQFDIGSTLLLGGIIVGLTAFIISSNAPFSKSK
ncbi:MAG: hypothetical protein KGZ85_14025 [Ignavibacterium sp.]|nr:hypothetical protein [Ignavibacterium sp.]